MNPRQWETGTAAAGHANPLPCLSLLEDRGPAGWESCAQVLDLPAAWFAGSPDATGGETGHPGGRRLGYHRGSWRLRLPYAYSTPENGGHLQQAMLTMVLVPRKGIWAIAPAPALSPLAEDLENMGPVDGLEQAFLHLLLVAMHSHDLAAKRTVARLKELRGALRVAMDNREMREIVGLDRSLGDLVISLRDLGLTLRSMLWALEEEDFLTPVLEEAQAEQRRIGDAISLVWERYLGVTNCYTGIVQNNSHTVMKVMTIWLALLMVPIALIMPFHMETHLPLEHWRFTWYFLLAYGSGASAFIAWWGRRHGFFET